ncbi:uncharacterized protein LOC131624382 [Vicia villosa]|uniref:uncharacterized protein LOC131624382 n=1 Tax=Vicia villosa TaxID=3911 RepID=UPI00273C9EE6|nr:uncharacterized protein LOC131624382 [Vicia villosa]
MAKISEKTKKVPQTRKTEKTSESKKMTRSSKTTQSSQSKKTMQSSQSSKKTKVVNRDEPVEEENMHLISVVFHHGGEFVSMSDGVMIYRGGVTTHVTDIHIDNFTMVCVKKLLNEWGYNEGTFRVWTKVVEIDPNFFQIKKDHDCCDVAAFSYANEVEGVIYVEHDVVDVSFSVVSPRCVNETDVMDQSDEEGVEGLGDSEDERATGLEDGFEDIDVFVPMKEAPSLSDVMRGSKKKEMEDEDEYEYVTDELDNSDPDLSDEDKVHKLENFKKEHFNKNFKFEWGMEFNSLDEFREAIREWSVLNGREIKFVKNESYRVRVECRAKCGFLILCSKVGHKHTFAIKTIFNKHTCARVLDNRSASSRWVAKAVVKKMQTSQSVRITDIIQDLRQNFFVGITVARAWKAKLIAKSIFEGDAYRQYANLRRYATELHRVNPGNTVSITVNIPSPSIQPRFGSFYFCFDGCRKGFTNGCKPFVGVDRCHLKTKYGGQLLIAVGRDPNDQYFPLAFGVVETETKETWKWFIDLLMGDIGQDNIYVFISDQQKGLVSVFENMSERVEHRLCLRHLYANFKKKFGGGALIRDLMMGAAKATYYQGWMTKMNELKEVDQKTWSWLMGVPPKSWCKHAFNYFPKCDVLMNNISESFNAKILVARDKPILTMSEWIRKYLMNRCSTSALKLEKWPHKVMPIPRKRLDKEVALSAHWLPTWAMNEQFQVTHSFKIQEFIVDISKRSCSCNFWELVGIPCRHAVAALGFRQQNPEDFVDECYSRERYKLCYSFAVSPINGQDMWPEVESDELLPPMFKKGPGRPRKLRIRETGEDGARRRLPGVSYRCTTCDKFGHNAQSCKSSVQDQNALKRKKKVKTIQTTQTTQHADGEISTQNAVNHDESAVETQASEAMPTDAKQDAGAAETDAIPNDASQTDYFDGISDDIITSLPDITTAQNYKEATKTRKGVKEIKPMRKRSSERIKINWFKKPKPFTGPGSNSDQPMSLTDEEEGRGSQRSNKKAKK